MNHAVDDLDRALRLLMENGIEPEGRGERTIEDISALEKRLGVSLPPSYASMLKRFGFLEFEYVEIYGLVRKGLDAAGIPNVVFATESERSKGRITNQMIRFMDAGYGPTFVLDCSTLDASGEAAVLEVAVGGVAQGVDLIASSFGEFVLQEARRAVGLEEPIAATSGNPTRGEISEYWKQRSKDFK